MWLMHGTTRARAERIVQHGPDVCFVEPAGMGVAENFSFTAEGAPSAVGDSAAYARGKAAAFPDELGAAIVVVEVPAELVRMAVVEHLALFGGLIEYNDEADANELVAYSGGVVQFDKGPSLDRLLAMWGSLAKEIRGVR